MSLSWKADKQEHENSDLQNINILAINSTFANVNQDLDTFLKAKAFKVTKQEFMRYEKPDIDNGK